MVGAYTLDELQKKVTKCFSGISAAPRVSSPFSSLGVESNQPNLRNWDNVLLRSPIKSLGMPFDPVSLAKIYRMLPVKDRHSLSITWQLPPQQENWKSKPCDIIGHLLGHEGKGSLLSALKEKSWVTSCYAGMGSQGYEVSN